MTKEPMKAPAREPIPPKMMMTNRIGPSVAAIDGSVTSAGPPMASASPANPVPTPKTIMKISGTLWLSVATVCGCVSAA
jgi:hypothetical protein